MLVKLLLRKEDIYRGCCGLTAQQSSYKVEDGENGHVDLLMADQKRLIDRGVVMSPKSIGVISNVTDSMLVWSTQRGHEDILDGHKASPSEDCHDGE